jgi:hypothetical protein
MDNRTKRKLYYLGQSYDGAKLVDAIGYIDLRTTIRCMALALQKHIDFSKGKLFLDDL